MKLSEKQQEFALDVALLILWAYERGYKVTFGETYRTPEQAMLNAQRGVGIADSLHGQRLAVDLNLFKDGVFLTETGDHRPLGEHWESMRPGNRWGGRFKKPDGNHYSREHNGRA